VSFGRASGKRPDPSACDKRPAGRSSNTTRRNGDRGHQGEGGALGLEGGHTIGELDAHREESPELIGGEPVEDIGEAGKLF